MRNLLVPVDLSEMSGAVVEHAACIAQSLTSKVWLIHVIPPTNEAVPFNLDRDILRAQIARQLRRQRGQLKELAERLRHQRIDVTTRFLTGTVSTTILAEAERIAAELIIMGSHGHGNVYHVLFGGVGQKVMRKAACPVMLVPPHPTKPHWQWLRSKPAARPQATLHRH